MKYFVSWVKTNIFSLVLLCIIAFLFFRQNSSAPFNTSLPMGIGGSVGELNVAKRSMDAVSTEGGFMPPFVQQVPPVAQSPRMVIRDTMLSLVTKDVFDTTQKIEKETARVGGYVVDSSITQPEGAASATISVRVPIEKRSEAIASFKSYGVKTVSETASGYDVTDQHVDIQARMDVLNKTKEKFQDILRRAEKVQDILEVQRELTNIQSQIDALIGQQKYLEQSAKLTKITLYLSTDELALPYTPDAPWRPSVVFKEAVRSLIGALRGVGSAGIWIVVYSPVWLVLLIILWVVKKRLGQ